MKETYKRKFSVRPLAFTLLFFKLDEGWRIEIKQSDTQVAFWCSYSTLNEAIVYAYLTILKTDELPLGVIEYNKRQSRAFDKIKEQIRDCIMRIVGVNEKR